MKFTVSDFTNWNSFYKISFDHFTQEKNNTENEFTQFLLKFHVQLMFMLSYQEKGHLPMSYVA